MAKGSLWYKAKCVATLLMMLSLRGTESSDEPSCLDVFTECSDMAMDLGTAVTTALQSGGDVSALCASGLPNLTSCQERAQAVCSGSSQESLMQNLNKIVDGAKTQVCTGDMMCAASAGACLQDMRNMMMENRTSMELVSITCQLYPRISACVQTLDAKCQERQDVKQMFAFLGQAEAQCSSLTNNGECMEGLTCLSLFQSSSGQAPSCSVLNSFVSCLNDKSQDGSCTLDESKVAIAKVKKLMNDLCGEVNKQTCRMASRCMIPPGFPSDPPSGGDPASNPMPLMTPTLTDPAFICNFMVSASNCYVGMEDDCSYSSDLVESMKAAHQDIKEECPAGPSGSATGLVPEVIWFAAVILTYWMSVYAHL